MTTSQDKIDEYSRSIMEVSQNNKPESFDKILSFEFNDYDLHGDIVQTHESVKGLLEGHSYPKCIQNLLAEMQIAVCLMTSKLKFEGEIMLQVRGGSTHFKYAVLNSNEKNETRGLAAYDSKIDPNSSFNELLTKDSIMTIDIMPKEGNPYKGIIDLSGSTLSECLETYFTQSVQVPTKIWIYSDAPNSQKAAGILIQALPTKNPEKQKEDFEHVSVLTDTTTMAEILSLPNKDILYRLYNQESVTLYPDKEADVKFKCNCSREHYREMLTHLNPDELASILQQDGHITTECHYCLKKYRFEHDDVIEIIKDAKKHQNG